MRSSRAASGMLGLDFESDDRREASLTEHVLDDFDESLRHLLVASDFGVSRDAKQRGVDDLDVREQQIEVRLDDLFEWDVRTSSSVASSVLPSSSSRPLDGRIGVGSVESSPARTSGLVVASSRVRTASERLRFEMNGNGWAGSNVSGVNVGRTELSKYSRSDRVPIREFRGRRCGFQPRGVRVGFLLVAAILRLVHLVGFREDLGPLLLGVRPSGVSSVTPASICCLSPPTRFMKNSSMFWVKMARNFTRSRRGFRSSELRGGRDAGKRVRSVRG